MVFDEQLRSGAITEPRAVASGIKTERAKEMFSGIVFNCADGRILRSYLARDSSLFCNKSSSWSGYFPAKINPTATAGGTDMRAVALVPAS